MKKPHAPQAFPQRKSCGKRAVKIKVKIVCRVAAYARKAFAWAQCGARTAFPLIVANSPAGCEKCTGKCTVKDTQASWQQEGE